MFEIHNTSMYLILYKCLHAVNEQLAAKLIAL